MRKHLVIALLGAFALTGVAAAKSDKPYQQKQSTKEDTAGESFDRAWDSVASGAKKSAQAGDWMIERTADGAIAAWHGTKRAGQGAVQKADDAAILAAVKGRLAADPETSATSINVDVSQGIVTLRGDVKSQDEARTAIRLATQTSGVTGVVSHLTWPGMKTKTK